jgi:hypothetical protein
MKGSSLAYPDSSQIDFTQARAMAQFEAVNFWRASHATTTIRSQIEKHQAYYGACYGLQSDVYCRGLGIRARRL